jgi:hypothetical protein
MRSPQQPVASPRKGGRAGRRKCCGAESSDSQTVAFPLILWGLEPTDRQKMGGAMASVLTLWCTTRQCEVTTDIWLDAEALLDLALQSDSIRCTVCGRPHSLKEAYLKPAAPQARPVASTLAAHLQQRRANTH